MRDLPRVAVDFGDASDDALLPTRSVEGLAVGSVVMLADDDGNQCFGVVDSIAPRRAMVRPDWATWAPVNRQTAYTFEPAYVGDEWSTQVPDARATAGGVLV